MAETITAMALALVTAVLFIFFILASQFESYVDGSGYQERYFVD
jgi:HAE1 family hydrophobic/amphiphilic exporter-1